MREETKHREAFECYWNLGAKRSINLLHEELKREDDDAPSLRTLFTWSKEFEWRKQVDELEEEARAANRKALVEQRRNAQQRHAQEGALLQQKGAEWLLSLSPDQVTATAAIRAIEVGSRMERDALRLDEAPPDPKNDIHEVHLVMGGPQELFMFPDPDQNLDDESW